MEPLLENKGIVVLFFTFADNNNKVLSFTIRLCSLASAVDEIQQYEISGRTLQTCYSVNKLFRAGEISHEEVLTRDAERRE